MKKSFALLKLFLGVALVGGVSATVLPSVEAKEPVKLIYDTDMGNDIDDVFALAMIHNLEKRGEIEFLALTITKDNKYAAPYCQLVNTFYGNPNVPIGAVKDSGVEAFDGKFTRSALEAKTEDGSPMFPFFNLAEDKTEYYDSVKLLRKTLASQPDGSVVVAQVGASTNLVRLLDTKGDEFSPLNGRELAIKKIKYVSTMAGAFTNEMAGHSEDFINQMKNHREYNIIIDLPAAQRFFAEWPTPIVASGFEVGLQIKMTPATMKNDYEYVPNHPLKKAYVDYRGLDNEQCTWDLTSILYAARPDRGYFGVSEPGVVTVDEKGLTRLTPKADGNVRILTLSPEQKVRVQTTFEWLCSEKL